MTTWLLALAAIVFFPASEAASSVDANQLIAGAHSVEATWHGFPGFAAEIDIELDGRFAQGRILVMRDGRVFLEHLAECHRIWGSQKIDSIIRQRLSPGDNDHKSWMRVAAPKGLAVCRSDDPFGPCHWLEKTRLVAVEHRIASSKQRLTTLKAERNGDGKLLPVAQVRHFWHPHSLKLEATETTLLTWVRVGGFDLPASIQVLSADAKPIAGRIVLSRHRLFSTSEPLFAGR